VGRLGRRRCQIVSVAPPRRTTAEVIPRTISVATTLLTYPGLLMVFVMAWSVPKPCPANSPVRARKLPSQTTEMAKDKEQAEDDR